MCEHKNKVDVAEMGDPGHKYLCLDCGVILDGKPWTATEMMTYDSSAGIAQ